MQHRRRPTDLASVLRAVCALALAAALGSTVLAAAGGSGRDEAADVLQIARQQLGDPYVWGGNGPDGWDCSGLTSYMWREVGGVTSIPRVSRDQFAWAVPIPREQLLVGDLVFFRNPVTHVALYAGNGMMVDASSAAKKVIERKIWTGGVVRFGRVPRPDMPRVKPWTPPPPPPLDPLPVAAAPAAPAVVAPEPLTPAQRAALARLVPLRGLPARDLPPATAVAARAVRNALSVRGSRNWDDLALVRVAWQHAGGAALPTSFAGIEARSAPVPVGSLRIGDLVLYGKPASHAGIYLGHGFMVDASPTVSRVVVRRVFGSPTVRFARPRA